MSALARYSRQIVLREVGVNGQQLLGDSSVLLIGLGGLGCAAAPYLAGAGIGRLLLADRDRVALSNLHRQTLYTQADIGRPKTEAARERLAAINADIELQCFDGALNEARLDAMLAEADLVLDGTDNFPTRFAINAAAVRAGKPLISGAAIRFGGQLAVFDPRRSDSACYACLYPEAGETQETCEEAGVLGPVVGVVGAMQALLAIQYLLGCHEGRTTLMQWNAATLAWQQHRIPRDPLCPVCRPRP